MLKIAFDSLKRMAGKNPADASSMDISRIYAELWALLIKPGIKERLESIGILNLIRLCYNVEAEAVRDERIIEEALKEENIRELVKNKFKRYNDVIRTENNLNREIAAETSCVNALVAKTQRQNMLLGLLKSKMEEGFQLKEKEAKKLHLIIRKPEPRAGKDNRPIIILDEETEFEAEAVGPEDKRESVQAINSGQDPNLRFKWALSQKSKRPFELAAEKRGVRSGKARIPGNEWSIKDKAYLEVELYDIRENKIIAKSAQTEVKLVRKDPTEEIFKRLEAVGREIYVEIERYNETKENDIKEGIDLSFENNLNYWMYDHHPEVRYLFWGLHEEYERWSYIVLREGDLTNDIKDKRPSIRIPQLRVPLDHKIMKKGFDNYEKGMALRAKDVLKFARGFTIWGKTTHETFVFGIRRIERDKEFKLLEKGIIKPAEKAPSLHQIISEEEKILKILERILKEPYPKAYKFIAAVLKKLLEWYNQAKSLDRKTITKKLNEKRNEILEANIEESERILRQMLWFTAWLKRLAKWLEENERISKLKKNFEDYGKTLLELQLRRAGPPIPTETPEAERKIKSKISLIVRLAERLEELERKRHQLESAMYGRLEKKKELPVKMNLLKKGPQIMPVGRPKAPEKPTEPTILEEREAIGKINRFLDEL